MVFWFYFPLLLFFSFSFSFHSRNLPMISFPSLHDAPLWSYFLKGPEVCGGPENRIFWPVSQHKSKPQDNSCVVEQSFRKPARSVPYSWNRNSTWGSRWETGRENFVEPWGKQGPGSAFCLLPGNLRRPKWSRAAHRIERDRCPSAHMVFSSRCMINSYWPRYNRSELFSAGDG